MEKNEVEKGLEKLKKNLEISYLEKIRRKPKPKKFTEEPTAPSAPLNTSLPHFQPITAEVPQEKEVKSLKNKKTLLAVGIGLVILTLGSIYIYKKIKKK